MEKVGLLCLLLTATIVVTTSGGSISTWLREFSFFENQGSQLSAILRTARNANHVKHDVKRSILYNCASQYSCWNNHASALIYDVFRYNVQNLTQILPFHCLGIDADHCLGDNCFENDVAHLMSLAVNLTSLACSRLHEFEASAACWEPPFQRSMLSCEQRAHHLRGNRDQFYDVLRPCLETEMRNLTSCTPVDRALFLDFVDVVIDSFLPNNLFL